MTASTDDLLLSVPTGDRWTTSRSTGLDGGYESRVRHESGLLLADYDGRTKQDVTVGVLGHEIARVFRPANAPKTGPASGVEFHEGFLCVHADHYTHP